MSNQAQALEDPVQCNGEHNNPEPTLTYLAARRLEKIRNSKLTPAVEEKATLCLLDYLGALVSGLSTPWSAALLKYAQGASSGRGDAHVMGLKSLVSADVAAFTNAALAHSIIRDDMHLAAGAHIGVMVIPTALALAQRDDWTGEQLLKGIVGGYELAVALGSAVRHAGLCNPHFRPSGMIGAFGAAAPGIVADASMSTSVAASALSLGANMGAGLNEWPWAGGTEINTQMGICSRNGISALDLARAGIYSSDTVLEGKDGFFLAYGCGPGSVEEFRNWLATTDPGAGITGARFKPVAGCNMIQTPLAVALNLAPQIHGSGQNIESIGIVTTTAAKDYPGCDSSGPFEKVQQTKMSLQYGVSAALLFGRIDEFAYIQYDNGDLQSLIRKCTLATDVKYDGALSRGEQPCRIEIRNQDGTVYQHSLADVPWLEGEAVESRFRKEAAAIFDPNTVDQMLGECRRLKDAKTCARLFELLALQTWR
ncbi:uncharacterized protein Z519_07719 [Cladophialophora bantiana CBS 173.52]|uniref:MmgE/PrpD family protein n=1 Tax=Cladophialophora bantiana (strain ATCC 10958 / CBS 173.52 / CDC B-1940 / NIH 8579) TaxID=1442370 RepID=A0A0D2EP39_CLAB1|nr:uncharacterized protein Z519_07719 [Cladophialophora bantiana CBS 173.52]KIW91751.1 hypothetical protein Z519_07719 [Cladophialophora bantiana CBS 173.52]